MNNISVKDYPSNPNITEEGLDENHSLKKMLRLIGENKQVIDFGCATGYLSQLLKKRGCNVIGVEVNIDAAKVAEQHCERVIVADLDVVSLKEILTNQEFDVAVFGDVLEHLRNPWKLLQETRQFLKPEGYVVALVD